MEYSSDDEVKIVPGPPGDEMQDLQLSQESVISVATGKNAQDEHDEYEEAMELNYAFYRVSPYLDIDLPPHPDSGECYVL